MDTLSGEKILSIYREMAARQRYASGWVKADGSTETTDTGYAFDGAYFFLEELLQSIGKSDLLNE